LNSENGEGLKKTKEGSPLQPCHLKEEKDIQVGQRGERHASN